MKRLLNLLYHAAGATTFNATIKLTNMDLDMPLMNLLLAQRAQNPNQISCKAIKQCQHGLRHFTVKYKCQTHGGTRGKVTWSSGYFFFFFLTCWWRLMENGESTRAP